MWLETDKTCYYPGDTVHGVVHVELEKAVKVKEFYLNLYGRERVEVVDPPINGFQSHYKSLNPFFNRSLQFPKLNNLLWSPGPTRIPFQFQLPADVLPSFVGRYASVVWTLYGWLIISLGNNLFDQVFLRVLSVSPSTQAPFTTHGPVVRPKFRLELPKGLYQPGENVRGTLTQLEKARFSGLVIGLVISEDSVAGAYGRQQYSNMHRTLNRWVGATLPIERGLLSVTPSVPFELRVPSDSPTSYSGEYSRMYWNVGVLVRELIGCADLWLYAPFVLASKMDPEACEPSPASDAAISSMVGTQERSGVASALPFAPAIGKVEPPEQVSVSSEPGPDLPSRILNMVEQVPSMNLLKITSELELSTGRFVDLNTVKKICNELVAHRRLGRLFDGEFYRYGLTPQPVSTP